MKCDNQTKKIIVEWKTKKVAPKTSRIGMMYCFKNCDKNRN